MALVATPGAADANSYLTVAEADAYFETRLQATRWTSIVDDVVKETALIMATRVIDSRICFTGVAATGTQALAWPRAGMFNRNGFAIGEDVVPQALKDATAELAYMLLASDVTLESDAAVQGISRIKAGPVDISFRDSIESRDVPSNVSELFVPSWLCPADEGFAVFEMV